MAPWSQLLRLSWHPELGFFESRARLLRRLEDEVNLAAFRWGEASVSARLGRSELLEVRSNGAVMLIATPDGDDSVGVRAIEIMLDTLDPDAVRVDKALFQFLLPIEADYDLFRRATASLILDDLVVGTSMRDWSVLLDGDSEALRIPYQVEFGIIGADEAEMRLSGLVGRVYHQEVAPVPADFWRVEEAPECGLFMDWSWSPTFGEGRTDSAQAACELWRQLANESHRLAVSLHERLQTGGATMTYDENRHG